MSWTSIAWVIPNKIKSLGLEQIWRLVELKDDWDNILQRVAGDKFKNKSRPTNLKNETLIVDCLNSVWANELRLREQRILEEIKKRSKPIKIVKISFVS
ncbi:MAG TPA: DUF721 domain-containing protein [Candidatus Portnoybacteria bacterium]|nr:DUF721 domain-containing protein [Candidatus Portnoybacteria bacterium]